MIPSGRAAALFAAAALVGACIWHFRSKTEQTPPRTPEPAIGHSLTNQSSSPERVDEGWTGSRQCAECHRDIWESYQTHPMAQSAAAIQDATVVENYTDHSSFSRPESRTYRVERVAERVWHHETMTDAAGDVLYDQALEIQYEIGSGKRGRSYVIDRGGLMTLSPITWYTEGHRWDLSPGYQPRTHQRFERRVVDGCLVCHVGRLTFDPEKPDRFGSPALLETAIGCERCHGPGREHIRWHESPEPESVSDDPIVNPARLGPARREDVCNQCHLQGKRILRYGKTTHDFRPGQRLEDIWTVFMKGPSIEQANATRAVGQVDQMRESNCFQKSAGRMGCISCHDPHSVPAPAERQEYFDRRCSHCHSDRGCSLPEATRTAAPATGSCIGCHMPRFPASNVPHTSQTDHRILRDAAKPSGFRSRNDDELFDHAETRIPTVDLRRARGLLLASQLVRSVQAVSGEQLEALLVPVLREYPDDADVLKALATLYLSQHRETQAEEYLRKVLTLRPEHEDALQQMAMFEKERGHNAAAIRYMQKYQAVNPWQASFHGWLAQALWTEGRRDEALAAAGQGLTLDPRLLPLRKWLAEACRQSGHVAEAAEQERILQRMQDR